MCVHMIPPHWTEFLRGSGIAFPFSYWSFVNPYIPSHNIQHHFFLSAVCVCDCSMVNSSFIINGRYTSVIQRCTWEWWFVGGVLLKSYYPNWNEINIPVWWQERVSFWINNLPFLFTFNSHPPCPTQKIKYKPIQKTKYQQITTTTVTPSVS